MFVYYRSVPELRAIFSNIMFNKNNIDGLKLLLMCVHLQVW